MNRFSKSAKQPMVSLKNRVKELRELPARNILGAPFNFRLHPAKQQEALAASLNEIGFYDPLKVFRTDDMPADCYMMIDGHARQELISDRIGPDTLIPCIITDLDEVEARRALLTHDALGAMAESDAAKLDDLLRMMETESPDLADMLEQLAKDAGCQWAEEAAAAEKQNKAASSSGEKWNILIECASEEQQTQLLNRLADEGLQVKALIA